MITMIMITITYTILKYSILQGVGLNFLNIAHLT